MVSRRGGSQRRFQDRGFLMCHPSGAPVGEGCRCPNLADQPTLKLGSQKGALGRESYLELGRPKGPIPYRVVEYLPGLTDGSTKELALHTASPNPDATTGQGTDRPVRVALWSKGRTGHARFTATREDSWRSQ